jgi:hypothetical protein
MWMSVVRWRASPQRARPRKWLTCEPGLRLILRLSREREREREWETDVFVRGLHLPSRKLIPVSAEVDGSIAALLSTRKTVLQVCCYVARSLSATDKTSFHSYCVFRVFCLGVPAVYVRKSNGVFATVQPSEADMFCGQLLRAKFTECQ